MKSILIGFVAVAVIVGGIWLFRSDSGRPVVTATPMASNTGTSTPTASLTPTTTSTTAANTFTAAQVAAHNRATDCYSIIRGSVYNLTSYVPKHPGGVQKISAVCGKDGTSLFVGQHGGSPMQENMLAKLKIGELAK